MSLSQSETATMKCHGCSREVRVPAGKVRWHLRTKPPAQPYVMFCSAKCQRSYVAREGARQQDDLVNHG